MCLLVEAEFAQHDPEDSLLCFGICCKKRLRSICYNQSPCPDISFQCVGSPRGSLQPHGSAAPDVVEIVHLSRSPQKSGSVARTSLPPRKLRPCQFESVSAWTLPHNRRRAFPTSQGLAHTSTADAEQAGALLFAEFPEIVWLAASHQCQPHLVWSIQ